MSLLPFAVLWAFLVALVILLAFYRASVASHEDETVHISDGGAIGEAERIAIGRKIERIELWGKSLTAVAAASGLALLAIYLYGVWVVSGQIQ